MEREVGGGIGMGNTCKPMALSFQCMAKFTRNLKKKKKKKKTLTSKREKKKERKKPKGLRGHPCKTAGHSGVIPGRGNVPIDTQNFNSR